MSRQLHLLTLGNINQGGAWRLPGVENGPRETLRTLVETAKVSERGTFDAIFFADILNYGPEATWAHKGTEDFEPLTTTAALASVTERLGLVVTGSATFQPPYHLARQLLSLDHISGGRAGWNLVTSFAQAAIDNFGGGDVIPHEERYRIAEEALEVVRKLWDSWDEATVVEDRSRGVYNDVDRIHVADHRGEYFTVKGPLGVTRSAQGQPVLFQAGSSPTGRRFAARHAEVIFTGHGTREGGAAFHRDIAALAGEAGRTLPPLITPSLRFVVGSTEEEARRAERTIYEHFIPEYQAGWLLEVEVDVIGADLDGPVPASAFPESTQTHQTALAGYRALAAESPTVRDFLYRTLGGWGAEVVGSAEQVADEIQGWFDDRAADGFVLIPPGLPGQLELFVDEVVPILRDRGIFRHEYSGTTLRDHLGLERPVHAHAGR